MWIGTAGCKRLLRQDAKHWGWEGREVVYYQYRTKEKKKKGETEDDVHLFQWIYELWTFFFMWDEWILFLTESHNFKVDWLWIMQMIRICRFLPTQVHEKKGRINTNWHRCRLCVERRAKIQHFNYCQVHSIRKQADKVQCAGASSRLHQMSLLIVDSPFVISGEIIISRIKSPL